VVAALDQATGRVIWRRSSTISVAGLVAFYQHLRAAYPQATRIYVVVDNWPVHLHPDVVVALEPQESRHFRPLPPSWPTVPRASAVRRWGQLQLPIQLIPLPTYASWCNPIEKLWRKLRQEVLHVHRWADDRAGVHAAIDAFLAQFASGSADLLRYVGLGVPG
jgi:transposase